jgi:hypothetical protein
VQACQAAFNTVCTNIGTRDLVQEHIAYKVWPLANEWEMLKETATGSSQGGLVYLKYTFWFRNQFDEPNDDWLDAIEATSDELFGAYSREEDEAMTTSFTQTTAILPKSKEGKKERRCLNIYWCVEVKENKGFDTQTQVHRDSRCVEVN